MTPEMTVALFSNAVWLIITMVMVLVVPGLLVGLVIAVFQAATQIQEQTRLREWKLRAFKEFGRKSHLITHEEDRQLLEELDVEPVTTTQNSPE